MSDRGYIALSIQLRAQAINCRIEAYKAENSQRLHIGCPIIHNSDSFFEAELELLDLSKQVQELVKVEGGG